MIVPLGHLLGGGRAVTDSCVGQRWDHGGMAWLCPPAPREEERVLGPGPWGSVGTEWSWGVEADASSEVH